MIILGVETNTFRHFYSTFYYFILFCPALKIGTQIFIIFCRTLLME